MQIRKITEVANIVPESKRKFIAKKQLQSEFDYWRAEKILRKMQANGLISEVEFNKIIALNRTSFSPMLAQIMPENA